MRKTIGTYDDGKQFTMEDPWTQGELSSVRCRQSWTGKTIFLVDKNHDGNYGTDQRRQRDAVRSKHKNVSQSPGVWESLIVPRYLCNQQPRWADMTSDSD